MTKHEAINRLVAAYENARPHLEHPLILWAPEGDLVKGFYCFGITPEQFDQLKDIIGE